MRAELEVWKPSGYSISEATGGDVVAQEGYIELRTHLGVRGWNKEDYLGMGIHSTQTGPRADVPDTNVSITCAPSSCQDIGLPGTPSYSLGGIKSWGQQVLELDTDL